MITLHEEYFILDNDDDVSGYYFWNDISRIFYYLEADYYVRSRRQAWLIFQHDCGENLRLPEGIDEWDVMYDNLSTYLRAIGGDWHEKIKKAVENQPMEIYLRP